MNEQEIQELLVKYFKSIDETSLIKEQTHFGNSIFDTLVLMGECLVGVEIKGDNDNYNRLKTQLLDYTFVCDKVYLATNEKDMPENLPDHVGWLAVRNGKIRELKKPVVIPQRDLEFVSLDITKATLKASNLPPSWSRHIREFMKVAMSLYRPLLINYCFQWDKKYKIKPIKNSSMLKMYLGDINHTIKDAYSENKSDWEINNDLKMEIDSMKESFDNFIGTIKNYSLIGQEHKDILLKRASNSSGVKE